MRIPTQTNMNHVGLELMRDSKQRSRAQVRDDVAQLLKLTEDECDTAAS